MLYSIDITAPGKLATMARPRGGGELAQEMARLRSAGVDVLVSALCADECRELKLVDEPALAQAAGLEFVNFPIPDAGVPSEAAWEELDGLAKRLSAAVLGGSFVVTHCRMGIGRASILAGTVLIRLGLTPHNAWERIRTARGLPVPDNPTQEAFLHAFADRFGYR